MLLHPPSIHTLDSTLSTHDIHMIKDNEYLQVAQVKCGENQNEGSGRMESSTCLLCIHQELVSDYIWMALERHVMTTILRFLICTTD